MTEDTKSKPPPTENADRPQKGAERRRIGRIVHDDRGSASVEWIDAPADSVRTTLSLEDPPAADGGAGFNPYDRGANRVGGPASKTGGARRPRRDLRALSEWIKERRRHPEHKRGADEDDEK